MTLDNDLKKASRILFVTGAGISAESGIPTYRGIGGLYNSPDSNIEVEMSGSTFQKNPEKTWGHIFKIEKACRDASPNESHEIIAKLQEKYEVWVFTQNVDGFHQRSGSKNVVAIHGNTNELFCVSCEWEDVVTDYSQLQTPLPVCPECGKVIRPKVVLFGERLDSDRMDIYEKEMDKGFDVVFFIGTTASFLYISNIVWEMKSIGGKTVEINPCETPISEEVDYRYVCGSSAALKEIFPCL